LGARVLRNRWKRKVNGRQKRDGNGKTRAAQQPRWPGLQRPARDCRMRANKPLLHGDE